MAVLILGAKIQNIWLLAFSYWLLAGTCEELLLLTITMTIDYDN